MWSFKIWLFSQFAAVGTIDPVFSLRFLHSRFWTPRTERKKLEAEGEGGNPAHYAMEGETEPFIEHPCLGLMPTIITLHLQNLSDPSPLRL